MDKIWLNSYPPGVPAEIDVTEFSSLVDLFDKGVGRFAERTAYINMGKSLSYRELEVLSAQFAGYLQGELELAPGARVALMMPNLLQYPVALFGILRAGMIVVNVNPLYTPRELEHQLNDSGATTIIVLENFANTLELVLPKTQIKNVIVATGSVPRPLPLVEIDNVNVLDNEGALNLTEVPKKLGVIGSGVIGLEMGSVWKRVGSDVTILEAMPTFLAAADQQIAKEALKIFTKEQGLAIELGVQLNEIKNDKKGVTVAYEVGGEKKAETFDKLIISIGRIPNTAGLNTEAVGLEKDERGFVKVDGDCRTNLPGVWAIGDVVRGPMLAHKASDEGVAVAERIAGQKPHIDFNTIPFVIYTDPEIAWVGKTEEQLKAEGVAYKKGQSGFAPNGRALALGKAKGIVKVLADAQTDRILGVHMIGPIVSELVAEGVMGMEFKASSEDIARIVHAHPTLSEVMHEAALAVDKRALHG